MNDGCDYIHADVRRVVWRGVIFFIWGGKDFLKDIKDFTYEKVLSMNNCSQFVGGSKVLGACTLLK